MNHRLYPVLLLAAGVATLFFTHLRFALEWVAWVSSLPFLLYLYHTKGLKSRLLFAFAFLAAWSLCILKIITPPLTPLFVFLFSAPISLIHLPGYLLWDRFKSRPHAWLLFPAAMTILEWIQYSFTPFASWGVMAYTQADNLPLMQSVSLAGMSLLSFLIYWFNMAALQAITQEKALWPAFRFPVTLLLLLLSYGALRVEWAKSAGTDTLRVAAVGTDSDVAGLPLPSEARNDSARAALFQRTALAAAGGAELVVWNEAALYVLPEKEDAWRDSLGALASRLHIALVAAYVKPIALDPLRYENKYLMFGPDGGLASTYHKHLPVPGEPCTPGTEPFRVLNLKGCNIGGAICYDYDVPRIAAGQQQAGVDLLALPSSDWRGIDPLHTRMAAFRAVEQGHSILRSTRFGLSGAITPYGEITAQMSSFDQNDKILSACLPVKRVRTLYSVIGDLFVYGCMVLLLGVIGRDMKRVF